MAVAAALATAACSGAGGGNRDGGQGGATAAGGIIGSGGVISSGGIIGSGGTTTTMPAGLLNPDYTTTWNPGILADGQLGLPLGPDGIPARTTVCASPKPGDDLNAAIKACPEGQVVKLAAGTYTTSDTVTLNRGVVLRGAGSQGAAKGGTTIKKSGGETALAIGSGYDQSCYASN